MVRSSRAHRHTLNIDEEVLQQAAESRPGTTTTALVEAGLRALIACDAADRLANMEGSAPHYKRAPRSAWSK